MRWHEMRWNEDRMRVEVPIRTSRDMLRVEVCTSTRQDIGDILCARKRRMEKVGGDDEWSGGGVMR